MYFETNKKNDCSGCTACMNVCPTSSILMQEDEEGFLYPHINEETCVNCNLCRKVCNWNKPCYDNSREPKVLAAVLKNKSERQRSTSGGIFYAIAEWIIGKGGIVYGAAFDENLQLKHIGANSMEDVQKIRGSKYLQSQLQYVFKDVKNELELGRWCYFTGTGCQVAGLKAFLRKDYPTLITSDLVCHGVPSQKHFNEHISYMEKRYHDKVVNYQFRDYKRGEGCEVCYFLKRKPVINRSYDISPYLYAFMYGYINRYSCYNCRYAKVPRQGDITLADFWGIDVFLPDFDNSNGCSLVLLNTEKGGIIWKQIKEKCDYKESVVADAAQFNGNLIRTSEEPEIRKTIYEKIGKRGYADVARKEFRSPNYYRIKFYYFMHQFGIVRKLRPVLHPIYHLIYLMVRR